MFRPAIDALSTATTNLPALSSDHQILRIRIERVVNKALALTIDAVTRTIVVGAIQVVDAKIHRVSKQCAYGCRIGGHNPAGAGEFGGAHANAIHLKITTEPQCSRGSRRRMRMGYTHLPRRCDRCTGKCN